MRIITLVFILMFSLPVHANVQLVNFTTSIETIDSNTLSPVIIVESPYNYAKTVNNLKKAINGKNYRLIRVQNVDHGYAEQDEESSDLIVYFCNFNLVNKAVKMDNRVGQFLPCRVTVIERDGKVYLMAINPKAIGNFLNNMALKETCNKVTRMYRDIMDEATF